MTDVDDGVGCFICTHVQQMLQPLSLSFIMGVELVEHCDCVYAPPPANCCSHFDMPVHTSNSYGTSRHHDISVAVIR